MRSHSGGKTDESAVAIGQAQKQDTSDGESEEQAAEREQAAKRTMRELHAAEDAEREQADNVQGNELY